MYIAYNNILYISLYLLIKDSLRPISCDGEDSFGGIGLTLIDSLTTL